MAMDKQKKFMEFMGTITGLNLLTVGIGMLEKNPELIETGLFFGLGTAAATVGLLSAEKKLRMVK
jgi:uncharacterized ferredoxin-like protein